MTSGKTLPKEMVRFLRKHDRCYLNAAQKQRKVSFFFLAATHLCCPSYIFPTEPCVLSSGKTINGKSRVLKKNDKKATFSFYRFA